MSTPQIEMTRFENVRSQLEAMVAYARGLELQGGTLHPEVAAARDKAVALLKKADEQEARLPE